jgi:hypothetical protein
MDDRSGNTSTDSQAAGFSAFVIKRVFLAMIGMSAVIYILAVGIDYLQKSELIPASTKAPRQHAPVTIMQTVSRPPLTAAPLPAVVRPSDTPEPDSEPATPSQTAAPEKTEPSWLDLFKRAPSEQAPPQADAPPRERGLKSDSQANGSAPGGRSRQPVPLPAASPRPPGVSFVEAVIKPLDYELNHRFWGWRPNDLVNLTDNVNNVQLGVLEVTRRTVVQMAERISRTGYNDSFDRNLENAMNWLMIKPGSYWFPSPETKYKESLSELDNYKQNLLNKKAYFHTRSENLIPLLAAFEDLLGSCDTNLVKTKESDGSKVGFTKADDYFYYAKGVSSAMGTILESVSIDFAPILSNRNAAELLHKAINSCRLASSLDPWVVTNGTLDGILANHRANMAAPVSHARYYLGQLIKTLAT